MSEPNSRSRMESYVGTDRLGRALTDDEKRGLTALLRAHDWVGACMIALRFAYRLTQRIGAAQDLMGRVRLRFVRVGWDPRTPTELRRQARAALDAGRPADCLSLLEQARTLDPTGDAAPDVTKLRTAAMRAMKP